MSSCWGPATASTTRTAASAASIASWACSHDSGLEALGPRLQPARIDYLERPIAPSSDEGSTIARHARRRLDDRLAAPDHPVDQRGLPDVRPSDHGHDRHSFCARSAHPGNPADLTRATISSTISFTGRPVESMSTASSACTKGETVRV